MQNSVMEGNHNGEDVGSLESHGIFVGLSADTGRFGVSRDYVVGDAFQFFLCEGNGSLEDDVSSQSEWLIA